MDRKCFEYLKEIGFVSAGQNKDLFPALNLFSKV